ncbi:hypothetical protein [Nocardioides pacificus]
MSGESGQGSNENLVAWLAVLIAFVVECAWTLSASEFQEPIDLDAVASPVVSAAVTDDPKNQISNDDPAGRRMQKSWERFSDTSRSALPPRLEIRGEPDQGASDGSGAPKLVTYTMTAWSEEWIQASYDYVVFAIPVEASLLDGSLVPDALDAPCTSHTKPVDRPSLVPIGEGMEHAQGFVADNRVVDGTRVVACEMRKIWWSVSPHIYPYIGTSISFTLPRSSAPYSSVEYDDGLAATLLRRGRLGDSVAGATYANSWLEQAQAQTTLQLDSPEPVVDAWPSDVARSPHRATQTIEAQEGLLHG